MTIVKFENSFVNIPLVDVNEHIVSTKIRVPKMGIPLSSGYTKWHLALSFFFHFLFLYTFIRPSLFTGPLSEVIFFFFFFYSALILMHLPGKGQIKADVAALPSFSPFDGSFVLTRRERNAMQIHEFSISIPVRSRA